jgi:hypothetical protein
MQYLLMIYNEEEMFATVGKEEQEALYKQYAAFGSEFRGSIQGSNRLQPTSVATTVRVRDGKTLTVDGPFAETKEQLGGYYLVEAANLDEAVAMAAKIPAAWHGSIEVRPIWAMAAAQGGN